MSHTATIMSARMGSTEITVVEIDRITVWLMARLACSP